MRWKSVQTALSDQRCVLFIRQTPSESDVKCVSDLASMHFTFLHSPAGKTVSDIFNNKQTILHYICLPWLFLAELDFQMREIGAEDR